MDQKEPPDKTNKFNKEEETLPDLPDKCPGCDKSAKNLLLHIKKKVSCYSKIDPKLYDYWKTKQTKKSKRKYQATYVQKGEHSKARSRYMQTEKYEKTKERYIETGKHRKVQAKYEQKFKTFCKVCPVNVVKPRESSRWLWENYGISIELNTNKN